MPKERKLLEKQLGELAGYARKEKSGIKNISEFAESVYMLILSTIIKIESNNKRAYEENPEHILYPSTLILVRETIVTNTHINDLLHLTKVIGYHEISKVIDEFKDEYHTIIAKHNKNGKYQNFILEENEIKQFYEELKYLLKSNANLKSDIDSVTEFFDEFEFSVQLNFD